MPDFDPLAKADEGKPTASQPVEANDGEEDATGSERTYTAKELETIVKDRIAREQKRFAKTQTALEQRLADLEGKTPKMSPNVEEDLKSKLKEFASKELSLTQKLDHYRKETLRAQLERKLNEHNCIDPEAVTDHFISRNLAFLDDDDQIRADNADGDVDQLVIDHLAKKPYLVRKTNDGGVGSKGPKAPLISNKPPGDVGQYTDEQLKAALGIAPKKNFLTNR